MNIQSYRQFDFSRGIQDATTWLLRQPNELEGGENLNFGEEIGGVQRRYGYSAVGNTFSTNIGPQGGHVAYFTTGAVRFVAVNNATGTATLVRSQNISTGVWTDLITDLPVNSQVFFITHLDEVYVTGYNEADGQPITPRNIDKTLNVSTTRNILNMPACYYLIEYLGLLYAANVKIGSTRYPDRVYKSSAPLGAVTFIQGAQSGTITSLKIDATRYLKAGMAIDIYKAGTDTKLYDIIITGVDKVASTISFASQAITVSDNDEIWLDERKGKLNMLWNTDDPTPESVPFLQIKPGSDSSNEITGGAKSANRLFLYTKNSTSRWDGSNFITVNSTVGCISHRSIKSIDDDWLIWCDGSGNVWARSEGGGQQENISRGIRNKIMRRVTQAALKKSNGNVTNNRYKLYLGMVDGRPTRVVYDFDGNTWTIEKLNNEARIQFTDDSSGYVKPYFFAENGKVYLDESGNSDDGQVIPFEMQVGRDMLGTEKLKKFYGMKLFTENAAGLKIMASVDGGEYISIGEIEQRVQLILFKENGSVSEILPRGVSIDWKLVGAMEGDPPKIEGAVFYFTVEEDTPYGPSRR